VAVVVNELVVGEEDVVGKEPPGDVRGGNALASGAPTFIDLATGMATTKATMAVTTSHVAPLGPDELLVRLRLSRSTSHNT